MNTKISKVILIGPMGAGKSTVGKLLASSLHFHFADTDQIIEERTGADIPWIFDVEGESGFRDRESAVLQDVLQENQGGTVIATGGGIVERDINRQLLVPLPYVVYLRADIDQIVERTTKDRKRPLLQVANPVEKIHELYNRREPLYREVAKFVVCTNKRSPKLVVDEIMEKIEQGALKG